jgi:hypothetical protein
MSSTPPSDETATAPIPAGPVMFQAPRPGPGRPPSSTSTSEPPLSSTSETNPNGPGESLTSPDPDSSTRHLLGDDESDPGRSTSSGSLGSEIGAEARNTLRATITAGIVNATEAAHNTLTDDVGRYFEQYRASDKEIEEVAAASARILSRKAPKGLGNPDVEDFLRLGVAVVAYVGRQVRIFRQAAAARRQIKAAAASAPPADQPA